MSCLWHNIPMTINQNVFSLHDLWMSAKGCLYTCSYNGIALRSTSEPEYHYNLRSVRGQSNVHLFVPVYLSCFWPATGLINDPQSIVCLSNDVAPVLIEAWPKASPLSKSLVTASHAPSRIRQRQMLETAWQRLDYSVITVGPWQILENGQNHPPPPHPRSLLSI